MRGLWSTAKVSGPGVAGWQKRERDSGEVLGAARLFAPLPRASYQNEILISDVAAWSGFDRPNKSFGEHWQHEGGLPETAKVAIENSGKFAGLKVVLGMSDPSLPGVVVLLRINGHLVILCVIDSEDGVDIKMNVEIETARDLTVKLAQDYCVDDAILLLHGNGRRGDRSKTFSPLGIQCAEMGVLYTVQDAHMPMLSVGWITHA